MPDLYDPPYPPVWPYSIFSAEGLGPNFQCYAGKHLVVTRQIYDANGSTVNYSGNTLSFRAKYDLGDADASAAIYKSTPTGISASSATAGEYKILLAPSDTSGFPPYPVDLQYTVDWNQSGSVRTVLRGILTVLPTASISTS